MGEMAFDLEMEKMIDTTNSLFLHSWSKIDLEAPRKILKFFCLGLGPRHQFLNLPR